MTCNSPQGQVQSAGSARYAGERATDQENVEKLVNELRAQNGNRRNLDLMDLLGENTVNPVLTQLGEALITTGLLCRIPY